MALADLSLFKQLNKEYEDKPLVPAPRKLTSPALTTQAEARAEMLQRRFGIKGKRVLDIGCGRGQLGEVLSSQYGCEYVGVDIRDYDSWEELQSSNIDLRVHDITLLDNDELGRFDRIVSFAVFEHIERPYEGLEALPSLLTPDGLAYLSANLYRGPKASHRYREVYFPFPHLLFDDSVFEEFYVDIGRNPIKPAWVNKLTAAEYREKVREVGLRVVEEWASRTPLDEAFYERFIDVLGRYPKGDLEMDFIHLVLTPRETEVVADPSPAARDDTASQELQATVARLEGENKALKSRLELIESSTSWKVTAPIRGIGDRQPRLRRLSKHVRKG